MNTNQLKRFATEARTKLREGIRAKIASLGYNDRGEVPERLRPRPVQGGCILPNGDLETEGYMRQWLLLYDRIQQRGLSEVYEEAAYTWFNRLVAIRIMQRQAEPLCEGVLDFADEARTPRIVDEARMGRLPQMPDEQRQQLLRLLEDDTKVTEQFALLISAWCHQNPILNACFGGMDDYTSLLLPINILSEGGLVDMLNHTDYITESDWLSPELIGWLYQFYISERKDEVFAKKGSVAAEDIPAATQIFTPNWIVKYMVQNTVGRIYLDRNPYAATLKRNWRYLVESEGQERSDAQCWDGNLESLRVADLACGSGHILNECFDLLFDLYTLEGYSRSEAVESIFRNNLTGVDLDTRAKQLATFALLLKACQRDISFADAHCLPNVLDMPKPYEEEKDGPFDELIHEFFQGKETVSMISELAAAYRLMKDADSLGSIMKFDITPATRQLIKEQVEYWEREDFIPENVEAQLPAMRLILALTEEYHALVMNPPYMGDGKMNGALSRYVKDNYSIGKTDLFTVFMLLSENRLIEGGRYGMINMQSWMFLSSFEALRRHIIEEQTIENMLHLGPRTFDELPGEVVQNTTFVICKQAPTADACGIYFRLVDGKDCSGKECMFIADEGFYSNIPQSNFEKIPGCPIGYWVSDKMIKAFERISIDQIGEAVQGMIPGNVPEFVRLWFEVKVTKIGFRHIDSSQIIDLGFKWFPYNKGGSMRKWYGNIEHILNMENGGYDIKYSGKNNNYRLREPKYYFKEAVTWSKIGSSGFSMRYMPNGNLFDIAGCCVFFLNEHIEQVLGFCNSSVGRNILSIVSPTLNYEVEHIKSLPVGNNIDSTITSLVRSNIQISKSDWDAHETSWDFQENELLATGAKTLSEAVERYKQKWEANFHQLHQNEEELNRRFIEIYGLEDELTPDVPLDEITILQQGEISIKDGKIVWHDDVILKQLISYAVGVWMGRYRLDRPGLAIAHPDATPDETAPYQYNGETVLIDDDGIIPLMPIDSGFADNAALRMADFVRQVFGEKTQTENLNYIEAALGKTLEQYFIRDFWKDHKRMYQNRPIYWLFSSPRGSFQVIAYLHRMTPYTCERIRARYLLPYIETLRHRIADLASRESTLSTAEGRRLKSLRLALDDCTAYHDRLALIAEQAIPLSLDSGVLSNYSKLADVLAKLK